MALMKIGIIGAGPIGSILGAYLAKNGQSVALVDILKDHLAAINQSGLAVSGAAAIKTGVAATYEQVGQLAAFQPDILFVCLKTPVIKILQPDFQALRRARPKLAAVSFQNGLEVEEDLAAVFGREQTLRVVINYAGNYLAPGEVKMSFFNKPNYLGALAPAGETVAQEITGILTQSGLETQYVPDIRKYVWEKVILNAALSPLCAITTMTMKQAMEFPPTYHLVEEILKEGIAVAKAIGYDYGPEFFNHCIGYLSKAGHHKTSMHIDIEAGRTTEIDYINKKIVDYGQKQKISTPYNDAIVSIIKALEAVKKPK